MSTRWFSSRFGDEAAVAQEEAFAKQTPVQKIATPDDVARAVIALLENGQRKDGSVALPAALQEFGSPERIPT